MWLSAFQIRIRSKIPSELLEALQPLNSTLVLDMKKYYFKCPRCKADDGFQRVSEQSSGLGCALFIFGGILPALIYGARKARRIQCSNCSHIFNQPAVPQSPIAIYSLWIMVVMLISVSIVTLFYFFPELNYLVQDYRYLHTLDEFTRNNSMGVGIASLLMMMTLFVIITIASGISNYIFRKKLKNQYNISPVSNVIHKRRIEINKDKFDDIK